MEAIQDSRWQTASGSDRSSFKTHKTSVSWTAICFIFQLVHDLCVKVVLSASEENKTCKLHKIV